MSLKHLALSTLLLASFATQARTLRTADQARAAGISSMYSLKKIPGVGFSLGKEQVFANNANMMTDSHYSKQGQTGMAMIRALEKYTKSNGCIPNLMIAGHGWGAFDGKVESISTGSIARDSGLGLYLNPVANSEGASIKGALQTRIDSGKIRFCEDSCKIRIHACSISHEFSQSMANATGCDVVSATYKVSPVDTNNGIFDHVWFTSAHGKFYKYQAHYPNAREELGQSFVFTGK